MNAMALVLAAFLWGPDDGDVGGSVSAVKTEVEQIQKQEVAIQRILADSQKALTGGKSVQEVVADLEKQYQTQARGAAGAEEREAANYKLRVLESQRAVDALDRRAKLNANLERWKAFAERAQAAGDSEAAVAAVRSGAWDNAAKASGTPSRSGPEYFTGSFTGPMSMYGMHRRLEGQAAGLRPSIEQSKGSLGQVEQIQAAAARIGDRRKSLQQQAAAIVQEKAGLQQQMAAAGPLPATAVEIQAQLLAVDSNAQAIAGQSRELVVRMNALNETIKGRNSKISEMERMISNDPNFYDNHRGDCEFIREYMEGNQKRIEYWYLPKKRLHEANQADLRTWDQWNAQHQGYRNQLGAKNAERAQLEKRLAAFQLKAKIETLEVRHRETLGEIDKLHLEVQELRGRLSRLLDDLRGFSRRMREWVSEAEQAVKNAREGR